MEKNTSAVKRGKESNSVKTIRVRELRKRLGLTQEQFAEEINRSSQLITKIESGEKGLNINTAIEISKRFGVSLDWLYELSDDAKDNASTILFNLREIFNIDFKNKILFIDNDLAKIIEEVSTAYNSKEELKIPDEVFKHWTEKINNDYNEKIKGKKHISYTQYYIGTLADINKRFNKEKTTNDKVGVE